MWTNIVSPVLELFQTQTKFKYMDVTNNHFLTSRQTPLMVVPLLGGNETELKHDQMDVFEWPLQNKWHLNVYNNDIP